MIAGQRKAAIDMPVGPSVYWVVYEHHNIICPPRKGNLYTSLEFLLSSLYKLAWLVSRLEFGIWWWLNDSGWMARKKGDWNEWIAFLSTSFLAVSSLSSPSSPPACLLCVQMKWCFFQNWMSALLQQLLVHFFVQSIKLHVLGWRGH